MVHANKANIDLLKQIEELKAANKKLKGERSERHESTTPSPRVAAPTPSPGTPSVASVAPSRTGSREEPLSDEEEATFWGAMQYTCIASL